MFPQLGPGRVGGGFVVPKLLEACSIVGIPGGGEQAKKALISITSMGQVSFSPWTAYVCLGSPRDSGGVGKVGEMCNDACW